MKLVVEKSGVMTAAAPEDIELVTDLDAPDCGAYLVEAHAALSEKYAGRTFIFASPFNDHSGWKDGDVGTVVRLIRMGNEGVDEANDMWVGCNPAGEEHQLWGGEMFVPETLKPLILEHQAYGWGPTLPAEVCEECRS